MKDKQVPTGEEGSPNPAADLQENFDGNWDRHFFASSWGNTSKVTKAFGMIPIQDVCGWTPTILDWGF